MRRPLGITVACFGLGYAAAGASAQQPQNFTFLVITDTHQTATGSTEPLRKLAADAIAATPPPAFVIDTGDVTEAGRPEEYARFKDAIAGLAPAHIGFYAVPGNHDVRWSPDGKAGFEQAFGKRYQSFDYGGVHFILLDSTVLLEHWGHFDASELDWLSRDLKKIKNEQPVMLFMHHWVGRDVPSVRPIDNEFALWPLLKGHNVTAIFTGHGHSDLMWRTNGVVTLMARGLYQGSYHRVAVTPLMAHIERVVKEKPDPLPIADLPLSRKERPSELEVGWDDPDIPFLARKRPTARLEPRSVNDNPDKETAEYRIDDGAWRPMIKDARDIWRDTFLTAPISIGVHAADIRVTTSNGKALTNELIFEVERDEREATRRWAAALEGAIQSSPTLAGDSLFVTADDGHITSLDVAKGHKRWSYLTKGAITGSPVVAGGVLYAASADHGLYAIEAGNGHFKWRCDMGASSYATPAVARGIVCIGAAGKIIGIDAANGQVRWTQPAGAFFQSRAATDGETFYLGGWDNTLYALDAATGNPRWKVEMGATNGGRGALSFYYSPAIASPFAANGSIYVCTDDGVMHKLNASDGSQVWIARAPAGGDAFGYSSPTVAGGKIYVAGLGDHGDVYALNASDGSLAWRRATGQTIYDSSPRLAADGASLAIMGVRGNVVVLATSSGAPLWNYDLGPGNIFSTPEYDGKAVYTTTMANDVQAINAPATGAVLVGTAK